MIHIFYVPGMFGSTVEHVLRSFTNEYEPTNGRILFDGCMHSFKKEFHPSSIEEIEEFKNYQQNSITTPTYPFKHSHLPEILNKFRLLIPNNQSVLIYADSLRSAELNLLFQYHKIAYGSCNLGLDVFCGENSQNIINWNPAYTHWRDMKIWELREWFSLFYSEYTEEWTDSPHQVPDNFLKISNTDLLFNTLITLKKIINFCRLTYNPDTKLDQFVVYWQKKQNYIVKEFNLLDQIVKNTTSNIEFKWNNLNVISESIVQQRLRRIGYEIRCNDLNIFPTDSISLYNLLEKC